MTEMRPVLVGCTIGDPAGIGPEVLLRACARLRARSDPGLLGVPGLSPVEVAKSPTAAASTTPVDGGPARRIPPFGVVVLGDPRHVREAAERFGIDLAPPVADDLDACRRHLQEAIDEADEEAGGDGAGEGEAPWFPVPLWLHPCAEVPEGLRPGRPGPASGRAALDSVLAGADLAASGALDGLCTAPLGKEWVAAVEPGFRGHTELLAERAGAEHPTMLFAGIRPHVALLSTHLPLRVAISRVHRAAVVAALRRLDEQWSRWFGRRPRIGLAALNPHAGEGGLVGSEEDRELAPAVAEASGVGLRVSGPWPADSVFRRDVDVVLALYHDQGTILAKRAPRPTVNVTLGLPYPRTSPDHGTAYEIAGRGIADAASMEAALLLAAELAGRR